MSRVRAPKAQDLPIGKLSQLTGVNIETIRYYERIRMLPRPRRTASGRRIYGAAEARTLAFIRRARELGFALSEIRALLALGAPGKASCAEVRDIAALHLARIREKISDLEKLEGLLAVTLAKCSGRRVPECPVIDVLDVRPIVT
jgi:MerR family transcriptional regulator, mercuric resistance operon regulatory protein